MTLKDANHLQQQAIRVLQKFCTDGQRALIVDSDETLRYSVEIQLAVNGKSTIL